MYSPYFISNSTILQFQGYEEDRLFSIKEILKIFSEDSKNKTRWYFKFSLEDVVSQ